MKTCYQCESAPRKEYSSYCASCHADKQRDWSRKNRGIQNKRTTDRRERIKSEVNKIKESTPCADCGRTDHAFLMDYDHLPEFNKTMSISAMISANKSLSDILEEIDKCELVCVRCHRIRTQSRLV